MKIAFYPAIYNPDADSLILLILYFALSFWNSLVLFYSIWKRPLPLDKYKFRLYSQITSAVFSWYLTVVSFYRPENSFNMDKTAYILTIILPQLFLEILATMIYAHLVQFSTQLNITFIFSTKSTLLSQVLVFTALVNTIFNISFAYAFSSKTYLLNLGATVILNDIFLLIFIVYPTIKMLISTLKLDSLKLMSLKTKALFVGTIILIIAILCNAVIFIFIAYPDTDVKNDTIQDQALIQYVAGHGFYFLTQFFGFEFFLIYFVFHSLYLDSMLMSVESSSNQQGSLYVAATNHIE